MILHVLQKTLCRVVDLELAEVTPLSLCLHNILPAMRTQ
jgi:hypothetical protein